MIFKINDETLELLPQKAIWFPFYQTLVLSDVHFGKVGHFRKAGLAIPKNLIQEDLAVLSDLIDIYHPKKIIFLGDLFHSDYNNDMHWFALWRNMHHKIDLILVKGNHDIIDVHEYHNLNIQVYNEFFINNIQLLHIPPKNIQNSKFILSGHIHPGISLSGKGKQKLKVPCFYFNENQGILPAFGRFTGLAEIKVNSNDHVFATTKSRIIKINIF